MENFNSRFFKLLTLIYQRELQIIKDCNLTLTEYYSLQIVSFSEKVTLGEVANRLSLSKSNVTYVVDSLEEKKLVRRQQNESDRRQRFLVLTKEGKEILQEMFSRKSEFLIPAFEGLSDEEKVFLNRFIEDIIEKVP